MTPGPPLLQDPGSPHGTSPRPGDAGDRLLLFEDPALGGKATGASCRGPVRPWRDFAWPRPLPLHRGPARAQRHPPFPCRLGGSLRPPEPPRRRSGAWACGAEALPFPAGAGRGRGGPGRSRRGSPGPPLGSPGCRGGRGRRLAHAHTRPAPTQGLPACDLGPGLGPAVTGLAIGPDAWCHRPPAPPRLPPLGPIPRRPGAAFQPHFAKPKLAALEQGRSES